MGMGDVEVPEVPGVGFGGYEDLGQLGQDEPASG